MYKIYEFLFLKGGPVMYPIVAGSVVALALILERAWALRRERVIPGAFRQRLRALVREAKLSEAEVLCQENGSALANIVAAGLKHAGEPRSDVKEAITEVGRREVTYLERWLELVGTIAAAEPLLGLLGTVTGLIKAFQAVEGLAAKGAGVSPGALASGIWEALITTAAGLMVGIPAYVGYRYLQGRVSALAVEMEEDSMEIVDLLAASRAPASDRAGALPPGEAPPVAGAGQQADA
ncbi:MAG: MotA/TolQ/ExbB proton channel family protein [Deltaproteobacteria bacterium]|nr:MotA/TolQ/ExbB proton channel family protein [Deltaproteobacteria bacterium]